jgi:cob(I)alamin adenosyltransferase
MNNRGRRLNVGLVQVYTGDGKGKTTAAVGLALRAAGAGLKVGFFQFFKKPVSGELPVLKNIQNIHIYNLAPMHPAFQYFSEEDLKRYKENFQRDWKTKVLDIIRKNNYDVVILDEILIAVRDTFLTENSILKMLDEKSRTTEVILTGRGITNGIMERADLITEMKMVKHPFPRIKARKGIEY